MIEKNLILLIYKKLQYLFYLHINMMNKMNLYTQKTHHILIEFFTHIQNNWMN